MNDLTKADLQLVGRCFSDSYREARDRFLSACRHPGAGVTSYALPHCTGPDGEELATDVARFGRQDARKLAMFICGTHGLEAAAGAATFLQWLEAGGPATLPDDTAVVLVHGINPYGWAYKSRGDHENVDVNRNCFDHRSFSPENQAYRELHAAMISDDVSDAGLERSLTAFRRFCDERGASEGFRGFAAGQYEFSSGVSYGGRQESWSWQTLRRIVHDVDGSTKCAVVIDWHTGIGTFGEPFIIVDQAWHAGVLDQADMCWGRQYVDRGGIYDGKVSVAHTGLVISAVANMLRDRQIPNVLSAVIEWGTFDIETMFKALLVDQYLRRAVQSSETDNHRLKGKVIDSFVPDDPAWRLYVLDHAERIYAQTIRWLEHQNIGPEVS